MKNIERQWLVAGALATMLLAGCAGGAYVGTDDRDYHHRHWHHEYEGRPPGYYHGGGSEIIVTPEPARPYRY